MKLMLGFLFAIILLLLSLATVTLRKTYYYVPAKELKRQAEAGDKLAGSLYKAVAYDASLRALLWIVISLSSAGGLLLLSSIAPPLFGFVLVAVLLWLAFSWLPNTRVTAVGAHLALWCSPAIAKVLSYTHPLLSRLADPLHKHYQAVTHTGLFETNDLLELVDRQKTQSDNRIPESELESVKRMLTAHTHKVSDVLTPRADVKTVSDSDTIGLLLLDELHAANQASFPVCRGKTDKVVGVLYLQDLNLKTEGKVRDYMASDVRYVHEDDSLSQALQAFFRTKQQLFVVVNSFEEYVGVLTLEHIVKQLAGDTQTDDFDQHHDMTAVANKHVHDDDEPEELEITEELKAPQVTSDTAPIEPEPESEVVTGDTQEPSAEIEERAEEVAEDPETEELSMEDETPEEPVESEEKLQPVDPDNLAALDLPDEPDEIGEGSHMTFTKSKTKKPKAKTPESEDEVVE